MRLSLLSTIGCVLLTPFILLSITCLAFLAVITSTITSSFLFLRLALLAIEMISGLTIESTNWLLSTCMARITSYLQRTSGAKQCPPEIMLDNEPIHVRRRKLLSSSLSLSRLPFKATLKSKYSVSVPGTPDPESYLHQMTI
ncbi:hypothetical protein BD408DRAFT_418557 [Parasitella parasitica]|nr:hypothetical protein BD408DRAFT_418557 [Parasitella parasitica]